MSLRYIKRITKFFYILTSIVILFLYIDISLAKSKRIKTSSKSVYKSSFTKNLPTKSTKSYFKSSFNKINKNKLYKLRNSLYKFKDKFKKGKEIFNKVKQSKTSFIKLKKAIIDKKLNNLNKAQNKILKKEILKNNRIMGKMLEKLTYKLLRIKYPEEKGYKILREVYLVDKNGKKITVKIGNKKEGRRVDFAVIKGNKLIRLIEVTTKTANKKYQILKERKIRKLRDVYIKFKNKLIKVPKNMKIEIVRELEGI
ncbi:MAG: hypothetical protein DSY53_01015 [Persephonella sp.]|nr:MAG: hypothetical protein DSY53_01015 [Persephonella sp.]